MARHPPGKDIQHIRLSKGPLQTLRIALVTLTLFYAFVAGLRTLGDFDLGWQLATGRWIVDHRQIPVADVFSYTAAGTEWIYPVLSQVVLYLTYVVGGYGLLSWLGAAACVGTVAVLLRRSALPGVVLALLSVPLIAACTPPRTEMFTAVLFAAFVSLLWHYYRTGRWPIMDPSHSYVLVGESSPWIYCRTGDVRGLCFTRSRSSDSSLPPTRRACAIEKGCSMVGHYTPVDPDKSVGLANLCCYRTTRQNRSNSQSLGVGVGRVATYSRRALKNVCMAQPGKHFVLADFAGCAGRCVRTYKKAVCGFCPSGERGLCGGSCNSDGSVLCDAYRRRRRSDPGRDDDIHFRKGSDPFRDPSEIYSDHGGSSNCACRPLCWCTRRRPCYRPGVSLGPLHIFDFWGGRISVAAEAGSGFCAARAATTQSFPRLQFRWVRGLEYVAGLPGLHRWPISAFWRRLTVAQWKLVGAAIGFGIVDEGSRHTRNQHTAAIDGL